MVHIRRSALAWLVLGAWLTQPVVRADLIYYRPDEPITFGIGTYDLDMDFDGTIDIQLRTTGSALDCTPSGDNAVLAIPQAPPDVGSLVLPLQLGDPVGPTPTPPNTWVSAGGSPWFVSCQGEGCIGLWQYPNDNAYFGLQFDIDGETHYGWVHLENSIYGVQATIHEWAYESTPDTGLSAGVIPEPATMLLLLGGLGVLALHMKRAL